MGTQLTKVIWFTGLSGSGKTTLATLTEQHFQQLGFKCCLLDGDVVRKGLNKDLGFSDADRRENIRRIAEVSKLMIDSGLVVIAAFVSPYEADRQWYARSLVLRILLKCLSIVQSRFANSVM